MNIVPFFFRLRFQLFGIAVDLTIRRWKAPSREQQLPPRMPRSKASALHRQGLLNVERGMATN